jgi:hypothetical protein
MQRASKSIHIDHIYSNLRLTGGREADTYRPTLNPPDLWVTGGGLFEKDTIMQTNLIVNGRMYGNIFSNEIAVDVLAEAYVNSGISVVSDLNVNASKDLKVDTIKSWDGDDLTFATSNSNRINVESDGIDMQCHNLYDVGNIINLNCPELTISSTDLIINTSNCAIGGNVSFLGSFEVAGNVSVVGNLIVPDLYVHTIHGLSPVSFSDIASFGKGANFKQLVQLITADLQATLGSRVQIKDSNLGGKLEMLDKTPITMNQGLLHNIGGNVMVTKLAATDGGKLLLDGGDHIVMGGNVMITPISSNIVGGGQLMMMDGGDMHVMGGNLVITNHNLTGKGSIQVLDQGTINLGGGDINVTQGGNVIVQDSGSLVLTGGQVVFIDPNTMLSTSVRFDIFAVTAVATLQSIPTGAVGAIITFNTVNPNNVAISGTWNGSTSFTVDGNGWYSLEGAADLGSINQKMALDFLINGAETVATIGDTRLCDTNLPARIHIVNTVYLLANDIVTLRVRQATGLPVTLQQASMVIQRLSS